MNSGVTSRSKTNKYDTIEEEMPEEKDETKLGKRDPKNKKGRKTAEMDIE